MSGSWWNEIAATEAAKRLASAEARVNYLQCANVANIGPSERVALDLNLRIANAEYWRALNDYKKTIARIS